MIGEKFFFFNFVLNIAVTELRCDDKVDSFVFFALQNLESVTRVRPTPSFIKDALKMACPPVH